MKNVCEITRGDEVVQASMRVLSVMSHELLTPMNAVIGFTDLLFQTNPTAQQEELLRALKISENTLLAHLRNILDYSEMKNNETKFDRVRFSVRKLLESMAIFYSGRVNTAELELKLSVDHDLSHQLIGDPVRLKQILMCLVDNAIKFTTKGNISVAATLLYRNNEHTGVNFEITDTGAGIPEDKIDSVFENFIKGGSGTASETGGIGLGLAIAKKLIEIQGGYITVDSKPGCGAAFRFFLTFKNGSAIADENPNSSGQDLPLHSLKGTRILVAEDEELNIQLIQKVLKSWDVECDIARNGFEAIEKAKVADYDLILMDLQMPVLNGYEAAAAIRQLPLKKAKELPIIAFTANSKSEVENNLVKAGMNDYIGKPFSFKELHGKIKSYTSGC